MYVCICPVIYLFIRSSMQSFIYLFCRHGQGIFLGAAGAPQTTHNYIKTHIPI